MKAALGFIALAWLAVGISYKNNPTTGPLNFPSVAIATCLGPVVTPEAKVYPGGEKQARQGNEARPKEREKVNMKKSTRHLQCAEATKKNSFKQERGSF